MSLNESNTSASASHTPRPTRWIGRLIAISAVLVGGGLVAVLHFARPSSVKERAVALYVQHVCLSKRGVSGPRVAYRMIQNEHRLDINGLIYADEIRSILADAKRARKLKQRILKECPGEARSPQPEHRVLDYAPRWISKVVSEGAAVDDKWIVFDDVDTVDSPEQEDVATRARNMHVEIACLGRGGSKSREQIQAAMPGLYRKYDISPYAYGREIRRFLSDEVAAQAVAEQIRSTCK